MRNRSEESSSPSRRRKDDDKDDHQAADSLENGGSSQHNDYDAAAADTSKFIRKISNDKHIVISMTSVQNCLKTILIWGSLLYGGYQLGLVVGQHSSLSSSSSSVQLPKGMIKVPHTAKFLFTKPPTLKQMYDSLNCEKYLATYDDHGERIDSKSLPIYTEEQWVTFRKLWKAQGGSDPTKQYRKNDKRLSKAPPDFVPPIKAGQTKDGKGRGLFATRDIKRGEMTYGGTKNYIFFATGHNYRRFLDALDDEMACDLMKFTWPQEGIGPNGESVIWGPMDGNALMNDGGKDRANTGCPPGMHCGKFDEYALRDVKRGEELLCDYGKFFSLNFLEFDKWKEFGL